MNTIDELIEHAETLMVKFLNEHCKQMTASDIEASSLDSRALSRHYAWYSEDHIITTAANRRNLDYYGGFEYVDSESVRTFGEYVIYTREFDECRVSRVLDSINFANADEHDEEDGDESTESAHSHDMYGDRGGSDATWNASEGQGA